MKRVQLINGDVANLLCRIVLDGAKLELPSLPPVVGGIWGDIALDGLWGPLSIDGPELVWRLQAAHGAHEEELDDKFERVSGLRNAPALLKLADGTRIRAKLGHCSGWGARFGVRPTYTCEFNLWRVEGVTPARWAGTLQGVGFLNSNMIVAGTRTNSSFFARSMRVHGRYTWYVLDARTDDQHSVVVVDGGPAPLEFDALGADFNALQVAFGAPLQLDTLVALDGPGNIVGCAGVHLGGNRATKRHRPADGPVPDEVADECWIPVFFNRLACAMADESLPWGMACNAYLDSLSDSTIDSRYLKLHVALEAFAKALLNREQTTNVTPRTLVRDADAWVRWVRARRDELRGMVGDPSRADVFVNKVTSAMALPSSGVVADALRRLKPPLVIDERVLDELRKRNVPAHNFSMNKPGVDYDVDRDVERIDVLRSLFAALIARACGYDGAIAGWVTGNASKWKPQPDWWPAPPESTTAEARESFRCERFSQQNPVRERFRSRLRTRQSPVR